MIYDKKQTLWIDEAGTHIPYNRTTKLERLKEHNAKNIIHDAIAINAKLSEFKNKLKELNDAIYLLAAEENGIKPDAKGNFTWFSFDRSIKVEININERIDFDDLTIKAAKQKLDDFLNENIDAKIDFAKELVMDAFTTTKGKLDAKKVLGLLKYRGKISHPVFQEACSLIEHSVRRPDSKTYHRISVRENGEDYKAIELNFSNI